jgi:hypothetical protein
VSFNVENGRLSGLDRLGMVISSACVIHCLALPLAAAMLPLLSVTLPGDEWIHKVLLGLALPVTGLALYRGWRRHHSLFPLVTGATGLSIVGLALLAQSEALEAFLSATGGSIVVWAHLRNWRTHHP